MYNLSCILPGRAGDRSHWNAQVTEPHQYFGNIHIHSIGVSSLSPEPSKLCECFGRMSVLLSDVPSFNAFPLKDTFLSCGTDEKKSTHKCVP
ncbi:hypothetical protein BaRGS_00018854 [Batillaria attramentaria]|uniref:Uncharacterized protein n=1 Tax=Batillaria attramentaria TaxID=370345 RepID=A0ABD0KRW0_9CAEN